MIAARSLSRRALQVGLTTLALTCATALPIRMLGGDQAARAQLGFRFDQPARAPGEALHVAATNLRLVAAALLAACAVRARAQLRVPLDITLAALLALNSAVAGVALAAYDARLAVAVVLHAPLELAAFALAGGAYLAARAGELAARQLACAAVGAVCLLAAGAVVETYLQIGSRS